MGYVIELYDSRLQKLSDNISERSSAVFTYAAIGFTDEADVNVAVGNAAPPVYNGMVFHTIEIYEKLNQTSWKVRVNYIGNPAPVVSYSSTGGTQHITQSIQTVAKYGPGATDNNGGAIGFDGQHVAGVDKVIPVWNWTQTVFLKTTDLNLNVYYALTGHVNLDYFQSFNPGEVLFNGADVQQREDGLWEVQFKFSYQPNAQNLSVGSGTNLITGISKNGWDYLWIYYAQSVDPTAKVKINPPIAVYIEQIYDYGPFSSLGI